MNFYRCIIALYLISITGSIAQPFPPVLRNAMTTNVAGTAVKSVNDLFVTNFSGAITHTQWNFFGRSPNTVARLTDISNIVNSVSGSATNAISTIQSNGVNVSSMATNLNFVDSPTVTVLMTNNPSGHIHVSFQSTGGAGGETNWLGDAGTTNATRIGLADGKANNTNLVKTLMGGNGIVLTNNVGGTNVMIAIDPAVVATQTDLNAASNVLRADIATKQTGDQVLSNLVGTVAFNVTNVISLSTSNALSKPITNLYSAGTLTLRGIEAGANVTIIANPSNYVIAASGGGSGSLAVQTNRVNLGTETNLNFITGNAISILSTNLSGTNDIQFNFTTFVDVTSPPYNAKGDGTTDDTAAFQNAVTNVGATVMVPYRAAGYLINNVTITNNVTLSGPGGQQSKIIFNPAATGFMFDGHTNNFGITIRNLELYGTNDSASYSGVSAAGVRSGVRLMGYANGNKLDNLYVHGFDNAGVFITSSNTSTLTAVVLGSNNVSITQCEFRRNFISLDVDDSLSEYVRIDNCRAYESRFGFMIGSGSALMTGCQAFTNRFAFYIHGTNNDGHGSIVGAIINHNVYPLTFDTVASGFLVDSCQIWEGIVWITNSTMVQVQNCMGSVGEFQCSTGGRNWVRNNRWFTTFGNTVTHSFGGGAADMVIFSDNIANNGTVIGEHSLYAYSNVTFQGNSAFTNVSGTNYVVGSQHVNRSIISNSLALLNFGPSVGAVWTCTNATTGEGRWGTNQGQIFLSVQSGLIPIPPSPSLDQGTNQTWRLLFDDATNEVVYYQFPLPDNYYTNAQIMFHYSTLAAAANTSNVWEVAVMVVPGMGGKTINADSYNGSVSLTQQVNSTAGFLNTAMLSCNATSAVSGDLLKLKLTRKGTNVFDNATGDAALHSIMFEYDKKAL